MTPEPAPPMPKSARRRRRRRPSSRTTVRFGVLVAIALFGAPSDDSSEGRGGGVRVATASPLPPFPPPRPDDGRPDDEDEDDRDREDDVFLRRLLRLGRPSSVEKDVPSPPSAVDFSVHDSHSPPPNDVEASSVPKPKEHDRDGSDVASNRIVGGSYAPKNRYPYFVRIDIGGSFGCGGALVSDEFVLTAAHCDVGRFDVHVGPRTIYDSGIAAMGVKKKIVHPKWDRSTYDYDFLLLKLSGRAPSSVPRIALDDPSKPSSSGRATAMGMGLTTEGGSLSPALRRVSLDRISNGECNGKYNPYGYGIYPSMMCTHTPKKDGCQGDSGGPLVDELRSNGDPRRDVLVGVVSWGIGCAQARFPGVFGRASVVKSWVEQTVCDESSHPKPDYCPGAVTTAPTDAPTKRPTARPTEPPTEGPTDEPTEGPSRVPSTPPSEAPSSTPTEGPSTAPAATNATAAEDSDRAAHSPTSQPSSAPSSSPAETGDGRPLLTDDFKPFNFDATGDVDPMTTTTTTTTTTKPAAVQKQSDVAAAAATAIKKRRRRRRRQKNQKRMQNGRA